MPNPAAPHTLDTLRARASNSRKAGPTAQAADLAALQQALLQATDGAFVVAQVGHAASPHGREAREASWQVVWHNPAFAAHVGHTTVLGAGLADLWWPEDRRSPARRRLRRCLHRPQPFSQEVRLHATGSTRRVLDVQLTPTTHQGRPAFVGLQRDVSRRVRAAERLAHLAFHDALTDLPNRTLLQDRLKERLRGEPEPLAVAYLDLDGFKTINDVHGHAIGDALLRTTAQRIRRALRQADVVARMGGDEFAVMLPGLDTEAAIATVADKLIAAITAPVRLGELCLSPSTSIGFAQCPAHGTHAAELLEHADQAMLSVKRGGKNGWALYHATPTASASDAQRAAMLQAVQEGALRLNHATLRAPRDRLSEAKAHWAVVGWTDSTLPDLSSPRVRQQLRDEGRTADVLRWLCNHIPARGAPLLLPVWNLDDLSVLPQLPEAGPPPSWGLVLTEEVWATAGARELEALRTLQRQGVPLVVDGLTLSALTVSKLSSLPLTAARMTPAGLSPYGPEGVQRAVATLARSAGLQVIVHHEEEACPDDLLWHPPVSDGPPAEVTRGHASTAPPL